MFLLIGYLVSFTNNLRKVNTETQIHEFLVSTDGAKRKVRDYMETSSRTLRDWKKLIGLNDWTAEEIPRKLDDLISSHLLCGHHGPGAPDRHPAGLFLCRAGGEAGGI